MKIKLADGTEVEVADDSSLAVAARELEKVKALGYDSIEAYQTATDGKISKLEKHGTDNDDFINRQKTELGTLRKENDVLKSGEGDASPKKEDKAEDKAETPEEREAKFLAENKGIQSALTDDEKAHADAEYVKAYQDSAPEMRTLLGTEEGKREFFKMVFPDKKETEQAPISLFSKPDEKKLSIGEQIRVAIEDDDAGRSRRPVIPKVGGTGFKDSKLLKVDRVKRSDIRPSSRGGGVLDTLRQLDKQGD